MTINQLVDKAINYFQSKDVDITKMQRFLRDNNLKLPPEVTVTVHNHYKKRLLSEHKRMGEVVYQEDYSSFIALKKDINMFIESISKNLSMLELVTLKQKIDALVDAAVLWAKR